MIARPKHASNRLHRCGALTVEVALVMGIFLMFLFGVFEYCRYLLMTHVAYNAVRDGARYAVVNVDKPSDFPTVDYNDGSVTYLSIGNYVDSRMGGVKTMISSYAISVFPCDSAQLSASPPVVAPKPSFTSWNEAQFGERIAVRVTGTYTPALPSLLLMGTSIPLNITVTMGSEG